MAPDFVFCDVFADRPFAGNQLAVFLDARDITENVMATLAREFGWSEITFVVAAGDDVPPRVRIWTPFGELPFAGHPTIGTAVVLVWAGRAPSGPFVLELGVGPVEVEVELSGNMGRATMTQRPPEFGAEYEDREGLARALGLEEGDLAPELPAQMVSTGLEHFMVPLRSLEALQRVRPLSQYLPGVLRQIGARWAYCFTTDTPETPAAARARLVSSEGEDPATGSAAGPLGAYLVRYGLHRAGLIEIEQGIEMGRPSRLSINVPVQSGEIGPVQVTGDVRIWGQGSMLEP